MSINHSKKSEGLIDEKKRTLGLQPFKSENVNYQPYAAQQQSSSAPQKLTGLISNLRKVSCLNGNSAFYNNKSAVLNKMLNNKFLEESPKQQQSFDLNFYKTRNFVDSPLCSHDTHCSEKSSLEHQNKNVFLLQSNNENELNNSRHKNTQSIPKFALQLQLPTSIFVGNIPVNVTEKMFYKAMKKMGDVTKIDCSFKSGCWSTAFVTFSSYKEARVAIECLNKKRIFQNTPEHHRLTCCVAPTSPKSLQLNLYTQPSTSNSVFETDLLHIMNLTPFTPTYSQQIEDLEFASKLPASSDWFQLLRDGPEGANFFLHGIPLDWTEVTLMRLTQSFGYIVGIRVPKVSSGTQSDSVEGNRGFAFVSYNSADSGAYAKNCLHQKKILGKPLTIEHTLRTGHSSSKKNNQFTITQDSAQRPKVKKNSPYVFCTPAVTSQSKNHHNCLTNSKNYDLLQESLGRKFQTSNKIKKSAFPEKLISKWNIANMCGANENSMSKWNNEQQTCLKGHFDQIDSSIGLLASLNSAINKLKQDNEARSYRTHQSEGTEVRDNSSLMNNSFNEKEKFYLNANDNKSQKCFASDNSFSKQKYINQFLPFEQYKNDELSRVTTNISPGFLYSDSISTHLKTQEEPVNDPISSELLLRTPQYSYSGTSTCGSHPDFTSSYCDTLSYRDATHSELVSLRPQQYNLLKLSPVCPQKNFTPQTFTESYPSRLFFPPSPLNHSVQQVTSLEAFATETKEKKHSFNLISKSECAVKHLPLNETSEIHSTFLKAPTKTLPNGSKYESVDMQDLLPVLDVSLLLSEQIQGQQPSNKSLHRFAFSQEAYPSIGNEFVNLLDTEYNQFNNVAALYTVTEKTNNIKS